MHLRSRVVKALDVEPLPYGHLRVQEPREALVEISGDTMAPVPVAPETIVYAAGEWTKYEELRPERGRR